MLEPVPGGRGPNNRRQAETVGRNRQILENVRDDAEALALAAVRGYDAAKLAEGLALAAGFLTEYTERDDATGDRTAARGTLRDRDAAARDAMGGLRTTLRTLYDGQEDHLERLGVARAREATDRDLFLTESRSTLEAVREEPYATDLAGVGYPSEELDTVRALVAALATAAGQQTSAGGHHVGATGERDAAYTAFMDWMDPARRFLKLAFKDRPDIAARVGL